MDLTKVDDIIKTSGIEIVCKVENASLDNIPRSMLSFGKSCGVYIVTSLSKKSYIGSSWNVGLRSISSSKYIRLKKEECVDTINYYITKRLYDARYLESLLIVELQPELNVKGKGNHSNLKSTMTKTVVIDDEMHKKLRDIRLNLIKHGIEKTMPDIAYVVMKVGIDNAFEALLKESEMKIEA